jgi:two-component system response regulator YesN
MYSCLLVDDEGDVITAILRKIDWNSLGYEVPRYAHNGLEALDMAEEKTPDVVMTDIKMPYMDGLELSRQLKELYPGIRIIIMSGFDEFEYAKEAIRLEAEEYILKPIDPDELRKTFERLREILDKEADERQNIANLSHYYQESLPFLQENLYTALIEGRVPEKKIAGYLLNLNYS